MNNGIRAWVFAATALALFAGAAGCSRGASTKVDPDKLACEPGSKKDVISKTKVVQCKLAEELKTGSLVCPKGSMVMIYPEGQIKQCWIQAPATIDGVTCKAGVTLSKDGRLLRCQLGAAKKLGGLELPKETWVSFYQPGGTFKRIEAGSGPLDLLGAKCKGAFNFLHPNGKLQRCELAENKTLDGKEYKVGQTVCFDDGGKVAECSKYPVDTVE
jgi:hypothetical protein